MKGVAIFLVVFGHCIQFGNTPEFFAEHNRIFYLIYSFHMPLFALVSGYLFYWSVSTRNPREVFIRLCKSFILPVLTWTVISTLLQKLSGLWTWSAAAYFKNVLWFLWAIFLCSSAVLTARTLFHDSLIFYCLLLCVLMFAPIAATSVFMYPYFVAGYLWHRDNFSVKIYSEHKLLITVCLVIIWLFMFQFYDKDTLIYGTKINIFREGRIIFSQIKLDVFRWLIGFAGSTAVLAILLLIKPAKFIALIGTKTLGIYVISRFLDQLLPKTGGYVINFIEAVVITCVCYALSEAISRVKILNIILFGGR